MITELDRQILDLRGNCPENGMSCIAIAERLSIPEHWVWRCLRRYGKTNEFRAKQRNSGHSKRRPIEIGIYASVLAKHVHQYGSMTIEEAAGGGFIAYFGDEPGTAQETIWEAIEDAAEAADIAKEEPA